MNTGILGGVVNSVTIATVTTVTLTDVLFVVSLVGVLESIKVISRTGVADL